MNLKKEEAGYLYAALNDPVVKKAFFLFIDDRKEQIVRELGQSGDTNSLLKAQGKLILIDTFYKIIEEIKKYEGK